LIKQLTPSLLVLCTREPDTVTREELEQACAAIDDWQAFTEAAIQQRVAGFVLSAIAHQRIPIPPQTAAQLQRATIQCRANAMLLDQALSRVADAMQAKNVRPLVLKGPSLARTLYPSASLRPYDDIDLLVRTEDEVAAVETFGELGFSEELDPPEEKPLRSAGTIPGFAPLHHQFRDSSGRVTIELHTDPMQLGLRPLCEEERWQRSEQLPATPACLMLAPSDQLVQLSVHAHKHGFERLVWLKDLDLLLRYRADDFDWQACTRTARREGVAASVWYSLEVVGRALQTPVPPKALAGLQPVLAVRYAYRRTWPQDSSGHVHGNVGCRAIQFTPWESWRGMAPSILFMGRRKARLRATLSAYAVRKMIARRGRTKRWFGTVTKDELIAERA
jgi:hypothetical protein